MNPAIEQWKAKVSAAIAANTLSKITLSKPLPGSEAKSIAVRPLPDGRFRWVIHLPTRDITRNLMATELVEALEQQVGQSFLGAHLMATDGGSQLERRGERWILSKLPPVSLPLSVKSKTSDWMIQFDIVAPDGSVRKGMEAKKRQIDRFVELLRPLTERGEPIQRAVDMGCGKGLLTFAAYDLLRERHPDVEMIGIELRPPLVERANAIAAASGRTGLQFRAGTIADTPLASVDLVMALHACDTATDDALANGILAGARWLVVAPCCHRQVRPQLIGPVSWGEVLKHGILCEREAEIATDALRASILESAGYQARVFEFIDNEHTAKNLMITAGRRAHPDQEASARTRALAQFYGIKQQRLAERLEFPLIETA